MSWYSQMLSAQIMCTQPQKLVSYLSLVSYASLASFPSADCCWNERAIFGLFRYCWLFLTHLLLFVRVRVVVHPAGFNWRARGCVTNVS